MGTYTTNYNLFMPSIGEQGWGDLVNGNFTTIDATMKGLDGRIGTLETETTTLDGRVTTLEAGEFETINCAGTIKADVGDFSKLAVTVTTNITPLTIGNVVFTKDYSFSNSFATGGTYILIPEFVFTPEYDISPKIFMPSNVEGGYTCTLTMKNDKGVVGRAQFNLVINGVSTTIWGMANSSEQSTTFACKPGDTISFIYRYTGIGSSYSATYTGSVSCTQTLYLA